MPKNEILYIDENLFYGQGTHKKCFIHPKNDRLCIKIAYNRGGQKDLLREINYLKVLQRRKKDYSILPQYYGEVKTNLGTGYVYELIKDYNGNTSSTLRDFITSETSFKTNYKLIAQLLKDLKCNLYKNEIITMVLFPENILFQKLSEDNYKLRIINDMGSGVLVPLEYYFDYFAHQKIIRRWKKFLNVLSTLYPSPLMNKLIKEIE